MIINTHNFSTFKRYYRRINSHGTILVLAALFAIIFISLTALLVDLGTALYTQRSMLSVADATALEIIRTKKFYNLENYKIGDSFSENAQISLFKRSYSKENNKIFYSSIKMPFDISKSDTLVVELNQRIPRFFGPSWLDKRNDTKKEELILSAVSVVKFAPARTVGAPRTENNLIGSTPFAFELSFWNALPLNQSVVINKIETNDFLCGRQAKIISTGNFLSPMSITFSNFSSKFETNQGYVPIFKIYKTKNMSKNIVIGFGNINYMLMSKYENPKTEFIIVITKLTIPIMLENVSAGILKPEMELFNYGDVDTIFDSFKDIDEVLIAPVLTNNKN